MAYIISSWELNERREFPLELKERMSLQRIEEWVKKWDGHVYISFSGGKDSTVLLDLVHRIDPTIPIVYVDTGLEYPEIRKFALTFDTLVKLKPKKSFSKVIRDYGYPIISKEVAQKIHEIRTTKSDKLRNKRLYGDEKGNGRLSKKWLHLVEAPFKISHRCCHFLKKAPVKAYEKETGRKPIVGTMASDSNLRETSYLRRGCNVFDAKRPMSTPIAFWREQDIWEYIRKYDLPYSPVYDMGYTRTGCMFCLFGIQHDSEPNRIQRMKLTHPAQYHYCIDKLGCGKVLDYLGVPYKETVPELFSY